MGIFEKNDHYKDKKKEIKYDEENYSMEKMKKQKNRESTKEINENTTPSLGSPFEELAPKIIDERSEDTIESLDSDIGTTIINGRTREDNCIIDHNGISFSIWDSLNEGYEGKIILILNKRANVIF